MDMIQSHHELEGRDSKYTTLPFQFSFKLPSPRKWRIISQRDQYGRILTADVPERASL